MNKDKIKSIMIWNNRDLEDLEGEVWKDIPDFPTYQISNLGRVKSFPKYLSQTRKSVGRIKILRQAYWKGYVKVTLYNPLLTTKRGRATKGTHVFVAKAFIDNPENKPYVNHLNGKVRCDNRIANLEWATESENTQHAYDTGLMSRNRKLDNIFDEVVKHYLNGTKTLKEIAKEVNMEPSSISARLANRGIANNKYSRKMTSEKSDYIVDQYTNKGKSSKDLSIELECHQDTIIRELRKRNIPRVGNRSIKTKEIK